MSTPSDRNRPPAQQPPLFEVADDRPSLAPPPNPEPTGRPRLRVANRDRIVFRAAPRGALIPQDHPARVIGDDVDGLDLKPLYDRIKAVEGGSGRAPIDPPRLVTLGLYATVEGLGSARHLDALWRARAACPGIPGDVATNSHTRADFPTAHVAWLDDLLTNTVATLMAEDLVDLNRVARDGMRVRARAGAASFRRRPTPEEAYAQAQARVDALRTEVESDPAADDRRRTKARQRADRERADRIKAALGRLPEWESQKKPEEKDQARVSTTDAEATVMKMADGGFRPASDVQFATATASRVIVGVEVVTTGSDAGPMSPMVEPIRGRYDKVPAERLVAGGFAPHDASDALSVPAVGGPVSAPVPKPRDPKVDRLTPKPSDSAAVAGWRERMATDQAQALSQERAATAECVNALARGRGLVPQLVRGLKKVKAIAWWYALAQDVMRAAALRAAVARGV